MTIAAELRMDAAIDRTLQYFALFRYPLLPAEIRQYCSAPCSEADVRAYLEEQELYGNVFSHQGFFTILPDAEGLVKRRLRGNKQAERDIRRARRVGRLIYQFPFVSYVGISGSLSKGFADEKSDYDFFIITQTDRLWIARSLLHVMKKLSFLIGQQHKLCMNYFIDESAMTDIDRNIYTATELNSLIPVCGASVHQRFLQANAWAKRFLPNYEAADATPVSDCSGLFKKLCGWSLNRLSPERFNALLMKLTDLKWRAKWARRGYPAEDYDAAFKTRINISKNHHLNYQKRVLTALSLSEK